MQLQLGFNQVSTIPQSVVFGGVRSTALTYYLFGLPLLPKHDLVVEIFLLLRDHHLRESLLLVLLLLEAPLWVHSLNPTSRNRHLRLKCKPFKLYFNHVPNNSNFDEQKRQLHPSGVGFAFLHRQKFYRRQEMRNASLPQICEVVFAVCKQVVGTSFFSHDTTTSPFCFSSGVLQFLLALRPLFAFFVKVFRRLYKKWENSNHNARQNFRKMEIFFADRKHLSPSSSLSSSSASSSSSSSPSSSSPCSSSSLCSSLASRSSSMPADSTNAVLLRFHGARKNRQNKATVAARGQFCLEKHVRLGSKAQKQRD